jgi:hypothetical protein
MVEMLSNSTLIKNKITTNEYILLPIRFFELYMKRNMDSFLAEEEKVFMMLGFRLFL